MANDSWRTLFCAAKFGNEKKIRSLLEKNKVWIKRKVEGETALHVAVCNGHENVVRLLCKIEELLSIEENNGRTPLHIAAYKGNVQMAKILCEYGSPLQRYDKAVNTPLHIAVSQNHLEMVTSLVNQGAFSSSTFDIAPNNPFHMALQKNYKSIVQTLLKHADLVDICSCPSYPDPEFAEEIFNHCLGMQAAEECLKRKRDGCKEKSLYYAASYGRDYQVKRLIESGAKVNQKFYGKTPLHEAVEKRHISIVEFLLTKGADVNAVSCGGYTPLHYVSKDKCYSPDLQHKDFENSLKVMEILLKNGANVNLFNKAGKTPLHYAVQEKEFRPEKIRLLLDHKADVNAHRGNESTPIFFAKCGAILQMLIDKGANVNHRMSEGLIRTSLQRAMFYSESTNVDLLLENGAEIDISAVKFLETVPEINERIIDGMVDISEAIKTLVEDRCDYRNIIPILVKRHFKGEVTINSEEFSSASGILFSKFKECQHELEKMRNFNVCNLSLLDILTMPIKKLRRYATNEDVLKVLESGTIQDTFTIYSGTIIRRFKKAKEERDLIDSSWVAFEKIFNFHKIHLPDLVVYKIMDLLHMVDRKKLLEL